MLTTTDAFAYLLACTADGGADEQELYSSLSFLSSAAAWHDRLGGVSAWVLLAGFDLLVQRTDGRKARKLAIMRDHLRRLLSEEQRPIIETAAMVALWSDVINLAARMAMSAPRHERRRWLATAQAWAGGLQQIVYGGGH